uniref:Photosystem I reaction center subunit PsaK n=1 Tax=Cyanidium sp. THAL103 TaxID=3027999 RepID=A0A9Y1I446_9RHOD|nr:photosystem I subunit X [Cyanidium sp. THAL103]
MISNIISSSSFVSDIELNTRINMIMISCNIIAILVGRYTIKLRGLTPFNNIATLKEFGMPELLATMSLGHIIGVASILGLTSIKII